MAMPALHSVAKKYHPEPQYAEQQMLNLLMFAESELKLAEVQAFPKPYLINSTSIEAVKSKIEKAPEKQVSGNLTSNNLTSVELPALSKALRKNAFFTGSQRAYLTASYQHAESKQPAQVQSIIQPQRTAHSRQKAARCRSTRQTLPTGKIIPLHAPTWLSELGITALLLLPYFLMSRH